MLLAEAPAPASPVPFIEIAMIIFLVVFLLVVAWVVFARRGRFDAASRIPLRDDEIVTPRPASGHDTPDPEDSQP